MAFSPHVPTTTSRSFAGYPCISFRPEAVFVGRNVFGNLNGVLADRAERAAQIFGSVSVHKFPSGKIKLSYYIYIRVDEICALHFLRSPRQMRILPTPDF